MNAFRKAFSLRLASAACGMERRDGPDTLRAVMHSDLKILDPIWTTAYIVRNHGYMITTRFSRRMKRARSSANGREVRAAADGKGYTSRCARAVVA